METAIFDIVLSLDEETVVTARYLNDDSKYMLSKGCKDRSLTDIKHREKEFMCCRIRWKSCFIFSPSSSDKCSSYIQHGVYATKTFARSTHLMEIVQMSRFCW